MSNLACARCSAALTAWRPSWRPSAAASAPNDVASAAKPAFFMISADSPSHNVGHHERSGPLVQGQEPLVAFSLVVVHGTPLKRVEQLC